MNTNKNVRLRRQKPFSDSRVPRGRNPRFSDSWTDESLADAIHKVICARPYRYDIMHTGLRAPQDPLFNIRTIALEIVFSWSGFHANLNYRYGK